MYGAEQTHPGHLEQQALLPSDSEPITVAQYLISKLSQADVGSLHTTKQLSRCPLTLAAKQNRALSPIPWDTLSQAIWAAQIDSHNKGFACTYCSADLLHEVFNGISSCCQTLTPMLFVVRRSLKIEIKELCGLPLSAHEKGMKNLHQLIQELSAAHFVLDDRRTAAHLIDKAIDTSFELMQPVVLDLPDEVAHSFIPPHTYKRTFFNFEEHDLINSCWQTITSRLEQAHYPLMILGPECLQFDTHPLLALAQEHNATVLATEHLWGHINSCLPEQMQGYICLDHLDITEKDDFDTIFSIGVPADCHWLESMLTHHGLSLEQHFELFTLNADGICFGDGREIMPSPCLKQFFFNAPYPDSSSSANREDHSDYPWHNQLWMLCNGKAPLLTLNNASLLNFLIEQPPFAKIHLPPYPADETWLEVAAQQYNTLYPDQILCVAGNARSLSKIRSLPSNALCLLIDTSPPELMSKTCFETVLSTIDDCAIWKENPLRKTACIWVSPQ